MAECKFCKESKGELISPCHCKGSIGHVHAGCLVRYMALSGKDKCPDCNKIFEIQGQEKENIIDLFMTAVSKFSLWIDSIQSQ
jgi:E3 ubiquitin-protein ligase DOA10